jgi:mRNA-degrading endonuclease toxin of MazEF toxin-antitoxin module
MTRGEIWWVDFGLAYGSMPQVGIIDKSCLVEKVSKLAPSKMKEISIALADLLGLYQ